MKNLTLFGIILLALAALLYYLMPDFSYMRFFEPFNLMGILAGVGIGLIFGGIVGYVSKGSAIKAERKRKEIETLKKEKAILEKQAAELERQKQAEALASTQNNNTQNFY